MHKFDSQVLVDIFKADADNLLDFDGLAELLGDADDDGELLLLPDPDLLLQPAPSPGQQHAQRLVVVSGGGVAVRHETCSMNLYACCVPRAACV